MNQQNPQPKGIPQIKEMAAQYEKKIYDLQQLLEVSRSLCSTLEFPTLIESVLYICMAQRHVLGAGIFVLDAIDADSFSLDTNYSGMDLNPTIAYKIPSEHPLITAISKNGAVYTMSELTEAVPEGTDLQMISSLKPSLIVPLKQKNHLNGILLLGERIDLGEGVSYSDYERQQMMNIASLSAIAINNASLIEMTTTDMMTHLNLKHYFYTVLAEKMEFSNMNGLPIAVMMLDIDFFKKFNDTYGHACGDFVLQQVSKTIFDGIRGQDMAGRYGGEEFVVMLYNTEKDSAILVAERIRKEIENAE